MPELRTSSRGLLPAAGPHLTPLLCGLRPLPGGLGASSGEEHGGNGHRQYQRQPHEERP
jgi:hypothetical protein